MAEVHLARVRNGPRAGETVVVKRLLPALASDPHSVELLLREARLVARLHHPGIVALLEAGVDRGTPYLVLEHVDGCDPGQLLAACRARRLKLPVAFALYIVHEVAGALHVVHTGETDCGQRSGGVVHCDVSPSNVFRPGSER